MTGKGGGKEDPFPVIRNSMTKPWLGQQGTHNGQSTWNPSTQKSSLSGKSCIRAQAFLDTAEQQL